MAHAENCHAGVDLRSGGAEFTTDEQLLALMAGGDAPALGVLHDRWADVLHDRAIRMGLNAFAAEAMVESAFWDAWVHSDAYTSECGRPGEWLVGILIRLLKNKDNWRTTRLAELSAATATLNVALPESQSGNSD